MSADRYFDRVDDYFEGRMTSSEKLAFDKELERNVDLKEAVEKYKLALESLDLLSEKALKEEFKKWNNEATASRPQKKDGIIRSMQKRWKIMTISSKAVIAASILILLLAYPAFLMIENIQKEDKVFSSWFKPFEGEELRNDQDPILLQAINAYHEEKYAKAIKLFTTLSQESEMTQYYLAHCYFLKEDYVLAEMEYLKLINTQDHAFKEEAEWGLLATLYQQEGKEVSFKNLLNAIAASSEHSFSKKAIELKEKLKIE